MSASRRGSVDEDAFPGPTASSGTLYPPDALYLSAASTSRVTCMCPSSHPHFTSTMPFSAAHLRQRYRLAWLAMLGLLFSETGGRVRPGEVCFNALLFLIPVRLTHSLTSGSARVFSAREPFFLHMYIQRTNFSSSTQPSCYSCVPWSCDSLSRPGPSSSP